MRSESPGSPAAPDGNSKKIRPRAVLPWLIRNPDVRSGRMAVLRLLPSVSLPITLGLGGYLLFETALSLGFTLGTGALVGSLPAAIGSGPNSPATRRLILVLVVVAALFFLQHLLGSVQFILSETLGRRMNGRLRARVMEASLRPPGVAHLEDPGTLDKVSLAQGVATSSFTPGGAVIGLSNNIRQNPCDVGPGGSGRLALQLVARIRSCRSRIDPPIPAAARVPEDRQRTDRSNPGAETIELLPRSSHHSPGRQRDTHLRNGGVEYAELYEMQARAYR